MYMKKVIPVVIAIATLFGIQSASAATKTSTVTLTAKATGMDVTMASNMKMGGAKTGSASASFVVDTMKNTLCYSVKTSGLSGIVEAHIHAGAKGIDGSDVVPLLPAKFNAKVATCVKVEAKLLGDIAKNPGMYYVNLHTAKYADGAVRGQLKVGM
jgi:DNA topoisomerase VI subunit B